MKTALRINTDFTTEVLDLEAESYEQLSGAVGGLIQAVDLREDLVLWCNEEGKLINSMQPNLIATHMWAKSFGPTDLIMGDVVFTGGTDEEGDSLALSPAWVTQLEELATSMRDSL